MGGWRIQTRLSCVSDREMIARRSLLPLLAAALACASLAAAVLTAVGAGPVGAGPVAHTLAVTDDKYCSPGPAACANPKVLAINPGDTVDWQWQGTTLHDHTVTSCTATPSSGSCDGVLFDVAPKSSGNFQFTFPSNGTFNYWCQVHVFDMRGVIQVGPTDTPSPSPTASSTTPPTPTLTHPVTDSVTPTTAATVTSTAPATPTPTTPETATATVGATPGATVTPSTAPLEDRSDVDCDGATDADDVLALLMHTADTGGPAPAGTCAPVGSDDGGGGVKGDLDCDGGVDGKDALLALYVWAGLPPPPLPDCFVD